MYSLYSSLVIKQIIILLRYTITNLSKCSPRILLIRFQNIASAFINLNCITNSLYSPSFNLKATYKVFFGGSLRPALGQALAPPYRSLGLIALPSLSVRLSHVYGGYCLSYYHIVLFYRLSYNLYLTYLLPTVYLGKYALHYLLFIAFLNPNLIVCLSQIYLYKDLYY